MNEGQTDEPIDFRAAAAAAGATGQLSVALHLSHDGKRVANAQHDGETMERTIIYCTVPSGTVEVALKEHGREDFGHALRRSKLGFSVLIVISQIRDEQHQLLIPLVGDTVKCLLTRLQETNSPLLLMLGDGSADELVRFGVDVSHVLDDALEAHVDGAGLPSGVLPLELVQLGLLQMSPKAALPGPRNGAPSVVRCAILVPPEVAGAPSSVHH